MSATASKHTRGAQAKNCATTSEAIGLSHTAVNRENLVHFSEGALVGRGVQRLGRRQAQEAEPAQAGEQKIVDAVLQRLAELRQHAARHDALELVERSEERRVGKECRSRWSQDH